MFALFAIVIDAYLGIYQNLNYFKPVSSVCCSFLVFSRKTMKALRTPTEIREQRHDIVVFEDFFVVFAINSPLFAMSSSLFAMPSLFFFKMSLSLFAISSWYLVAISCGFRVQDFGFRLAGLGCRSPAFGF